MKKFKIQTCYFKNDHKIELMGGADTFEEAEKMAIDFENQLNEMHIDIFDRRGVIVINRETNQRWGLNDDWAYDVMKLFEC